MKKILATLLLLCLCNAYSQVVFEKGYFITNDGNRTSCLIENREWRDNPTFFTYKMTETDEKKTQNIIAVKEFGIDNVSQYKRFTVKIEHSQNETGFLTKNRNPEWKTETLFLQALVTGDANLYVYTGSNITRYFYETKTVPIEQLVRIRYISTTAVESYNETIQQNNQFRQQLYNNVRCAHTPDAGFEKMEYNKNALVKLFTAYNSCNGAKENVDFTAKDKDRDVFSLRITGGAYKASLDVTDPGTFYNVSTNFDETIFKFGFDVEYIFPFGRNRWSIFVNPLYQKFESESHFVKQEKFYNAGIPIVYTAKVDFTSIEFPIGLRRYFFINPNSKIFVNLGFVIETTLKEPFIEYTNADNLYNATTNLRLRSGNNIMVGVGYAYKRFSGEIRFNTPKNITALADWDAKYSSSGLMLGYKIF